MFNKQICKGNSNIQIGSDYIKPKKKQTQFERIKNMSVDELAQVIDEHIKCYDCPCFTKCAKLGCRDSLKKWLESEVE